MRDPNAELVESNRRLWNDWTGLHVGSEHYDVEGFLADPSARPLDSVVRDVVGDVSGARLLHLQCHFGLDSLRLALMGAEVTGVDFSPAAIAAASDLSERAGIPATFVESDVCDLSAEVPAESFDVAFTSYGTITWLPDLRPWAEGIASRLVAGGRLHVIDLHPTLWMFDEEVAEPPMAVRYPYFGREAIRWEEHGSYAVPDADYQGESFSWQHTFEEIVGSLLSAGLAVESLREYPKIAWRHAPFMVQDAEGMWVLPPGACGIPLMFSVTARKPR